jgi:heme exporter protein D
MDKLFSIAVGTVTIFVFGPVLIGAFANAVWPGFVQLLVYIFWFFVMVAAAIGVVVLTLKLSKKNEQERVLRSLEEERQRTARQQREELASL